MATPARERFTALVSGPEAELDLAEAALLIAQEEQPDLDVAHYLQRLDQLADTVRTKLPASPTPQDRIQALNTHLFFEEGLRGNAGEYYDPRNSFLNEVLERKTGIPITLSVVYMEVGRRLGLSLAGVGFPGHFLVKYTGPNEEQILDPFAGGTTVTEDQLATKLKSMYGDNNPFVTQIPQLLTPATKKEILIRMLRNLKGVYLQKGDFTRTLSIIDRILLLAPDVAVEVRDRGAVQQRLGRMQGAVQDFKKYLQLAPNAEDAANIRALIQRSVAQLN